MRRKKILLMADWFEPAYKAGGPIRSCVNFVEHMAGDYLIYVLTSDKDLHETESLPGISTDRWIDYSDSVKIFYATPECRSMRKIKQLINHLNPDYIYLNSVFSKSFTIYPLLLKRFGYFQAVLVLSPRGMLRNSALQFKKVKKKLFLQLFKLLGIHRRIIFLATDEAEANDIRLVFGPVLTRLASNFGTKIKARPAILEKKEGQLSIVFVGRIHPIKNLDFLLSFLGDVKASLVLSIVGVLEDKSYWELCQKIIAGLPASVKVKYHGDVPNNQLNTLIQQHHLFALPTKGENFGHAIYEAMCLGKPVLISDQTPWRNLCSAKAGWDLSLSEKKDFVSALETAVQWNQDQYNQWSEAAWKTAQRVSDNHSLKEQYKTIFT